MDMLKRIFKKIYKGFPTEFDIWLYFFMFVMYVAHGCISVAAFIQKVWYAIICPLGFGSIHNGSICWFSKKFFDVHDRPKKKGGDGHPNRFSRYICSNCGKEFSI